MKYILRRSVIRGMADTSVFTPDENQKRTAFIIFSVIYSVFALLFGIFAAWFVTETVVGGIIAAFGAVLCIEIVIRGAVNYLGNRK